MFDVRRLVVREHLAESKDRDPMGPNAKCVAKGNIKGFKYCPIEEKAPHWFLPVRRLLLFNSMHIVLYQYCKGNIDY